MTTITNDSLQTALHQFKESLTSSQLTEFSLLQTCPDSMAVLTFTAEIDQRNAQRRLRGVASRLYGVLESVRQFTSIVDTYVQAYPQVAALVWGSLKLTLLAASNVASYFDKLSEWFMRLRKICPIYSEYQSLFADAPGLQTELCNFYATVVRFCGSALKSMQRSGLEHVSKAFFRPFENEFGPFELELRRQSKNIKYEVGLAAAIAADRERKLQVDHRSKSLVFWKKATREADEARSWRQKVEETALKQSRMMALEKISAYDHVAAFNQARKKRHGTTSLWLSETTEYQQWKQDPQSSTFYCSGILGAGKTVLTAAIIDHILCSRSSGDTVSYFFCSSDNERSLQSRVIIGSIIRQILEARALSAAIELQLRQLDRCTMLDIDDLEPLFFEALASLPKHFVIIDGIDECNKGEKCTLLDTLKKLYSKSSTSMKLFITGRDSLYNDLHLKFKPLYKRSVKGPDVQLDIQNYIRDTIQEKFHQKLLIVGNTELLFEIEETLLQQANGMFLWVFLQFEDICEQETDEDIRKILRHLPKTLGDTYERILIKIRDQKKSKIAGKVFHWVFTAKRPLTLDEIREAIGIEPYQQCMNTERLLNDVSQITYWCKNLVMIDEEDQGIRFVHHSVRQFLIQGASDPGLHEFRINIAEFDHYVGEICVTYLNFSDFETQVIKFTEKPLPEVDLINIPTASVALDRGSNLYGSITKLTKFWRSKTRQRYDLSRLSPYATADDSITSIQSLQSKYAFLVYACHHWLVHSARFTPDTPRAWKLWEQLIESNSPLAEKPWTASEWANCSEKVSKWIVENNHYPLLTIWATSGKPVAMDTHLIRAVAPESPLGKILCEQREEDSVDMTKIMVDLKLAFAVVHGDLESARKLVGTTVFRLKPWESDCQALVLAAAKGYLDIVELLLNAGVNKDSLDIEGNTAAHLAAANGHDEVLLFLKDHGAWLQQPNAVGLNALQLAVGNCDPKTVSALTPRQYPGWGEYRGYQEDDRDWAGLFDEDGKAKVTRVIPR